MENEEKSKHEKCEQDPWVVTREDRYFSIDCTGFATRFGAIEYSLGLWLIHQTKSYLDESPTAHDFARTITRNIKTMRRFLDEIEFESAQVKP